MRDVLTTKLEQNNRFNLPYFQKYHLHLPNKLLKENKGTLKLTQELTKIYKMCFSLLLLLLILYYFDLFMNLLTYLN